VMLVSTDPRLIGYQGRQIGDLYQRILERIKAIPGVRSASRSGDGLLGGNVNLSIGSIYVHGRPAGSHENMQAGADSNLTRVCDVGPEYFETVGMTMLRGRVFNADDNEKSRQAVAIINETFARHYFGGEDPVGQRFGHGAGRSGQIEIIGVVKDAKYESLREGAQPTYYRSNLQFTGDWRDTTFQIRTVAEPTQIITEVRQAVREVDANLPLYHIKTLATQIDESLVQERLIGTVSSFFGLFSLLLAAIGLYGIMAYTVNHLTHEIGIRMALGAQTGGVLRMVLWRGMKLALIGVVLGLAVSFAATRIIASQLFNITPTDPVTFIGVPLLLLIVALLACFVPARRATRVDPLVALRDE
jgi:predicted permease